MPADNIFRGRKLVIATMHSKEQVIAPLLEKALGVKCFVDPKLNTDIFGTFAGEVPRTTDPVETARRKCLAAMEQTGCDLSLASEGSFGPHPFIGFVNADDEILVFMDKKYGLEIIARELSTQTNFDKQEVSSLEKLIEFAQRTKFPSHALILRSTENKSEDLVKGIRDEVSLTSTFLNLLQKRKSVFVETDMRAMFNPTRMKVITRATEKLVEKILTECPICNTPGFSVTDIKSGLPCKLCKLPTKSTLEYLYSCVKCGHRSVKLNPNGKEFEDPMYCDNCNP